MTTAAPSIALATIQPAFTDATAWSSSAAAPTVGLPGRSRAGRSSPASRQRSPRCGSRSRR